MDLASLAGFSAKNALWKYLAAPTENLQKMPGLAESFLGKTPNVSLCQKQEVYKQGQVPSLGFSTLLPRFPSLVCPPGTTPCLVCPPGLVHSLSLLGEGPSIQRCPGPISAPE